VSATGKEATNPVAIAAIKKLLPCVSKDDLKNKNYKPSKKSRALSVSTIRDFSLNSNGKEIVNNLSAAPVSLQ
jgi:hypothetical protein